MLKEFEQSAIRQFAERVAVPLLEYHGELQDVDRFDPIGTGTLFVYGSRLFLVTSDHVLEGTNIKKIVIPHRYDGTGDLITLGDVGVTRPVDNFIDVAVLEIRSEKVAEKLCLGWKPLTHEMTSGCPNDGSFLLLGYPSELRRQSQHVDVDLPPFAILTSRIVRPPQDAIDNEDREPIFEDVDLFFSHKSEAKDSDGSFKRMPSLKGMSGCTVWAYRSSDPGKLWTPDTHLRAVGIQSGVMTDSYIRAKSWRWAKEAIEHVGRSSG